MSYPIVALAALSLAGVVAFLLARHRKRRRAWAALVDDADFEPRFPETTAERPVTGRRTVVGRRTARR